MVKLFYINKRYNHSSNVKKEKNKKEARSSLVCRCRSCHPHHCPEKKKNLLQVAIVEGEKMMSY